MGLHKNLLNHQCKVLFLPRRSATGAAGLQLAEKKDLVGY
jgi:hypothetical protein